MLTDAAIGVLVPASETPLWPSKVDMNLDGAVDNVDYSLTGEIWAELTRVHCPGCPGAHDTQFRWASGLPWNDFAGVAWFAGGGASLVGTMDGGRGAYVTATDPNSSQCVELVRPSKDAGPFSSRTCDSTARPVGEAWSAHGGWPAEQYGYYADFDGDGFVDRLRMAPKSVAAEAKYGQMWLTRGSASGLGREQPWATFARPYVHHQIEYAPALRRWMLYTECIGCSQPWPAVYAVCPENERRWPQLNGLPEALHCVVAA